MAMLMMPMAIAETAKMTIIAILAIMATIVMTNFNFSMAIRGIQFKSVQKLAQ